MQTASILLFDVQSIINYVGNHPFGSVVLIFGLILALSFLCFAFDLKRSHRKHLAEEQRAAAEYQESLARAQSQKTSPLDIATRWDLLPYILTVVKIEEHVVLIQYNKNQFMWINKTPDTVLQFVAPLDELKLVQDSGKLILYKKDNLLKFDLSALASYVGPYHYFLILEATKTAFRIKVCYQSHFSNNQEVWIDNTTMDRTLFKENTKFQLFVENGKIVPKLYNP